MPANNYFPVGYQPMTYAPQQPSQQSSGIIWVQGETGAKAYPVAPNTSILLMDSESSTFYIKTTDVSGMPLPLRTFDYHERVAIQQPIEEPVEYVTKDEFERRIAELTPRREKKERVNNGE